MERTGLMQNDVGLVNALHYGVSATARTSATLAAAIAALGATPVRLFLDPGVWTMAANISGPSTLGLVLSVGTTIEVPTGITFTWTGPIEFGDGSGFTGEGIIQVHTAHKTGAGNVTRGGYTFFFAPTMAQGNILHVNTEGNDAYDGMSPAHSVATLSRAFAILENYGPSLNGTWIIQIAGGMYIQGEVAFPVSLANRFPIVLQGPAVNHPNMPTAIFNGGNVLATAITFDSRAYVTVSNLRFQNYTSGGLVARDLGDLRCINVHGIGIPGGAVIQQQQGRLRVEGGIITDCRHGIICTSGTTFTIGDPTGTSLAGGTLIGACSQAGILVQEGSMGTVDFCTISNCQVGIDIVENSVAHVRGCGISQQAVAGVRLRLGSSWLDDGTSQFFDTNAVNVLAYSFSGEISRDLERTTALRHPFDATVSTHQGVLAGSVVRTYPSAILRNHFTDATKAYHARIYGTITGANDAKAIAVYVDGLEAWAFALGTAIGSFVLEGTLYPINLLGLQQTFWASLLIDGQPARVQQGPRNINMMVGVDIPMYILLTINSGADSITIRGVEQYSIGGA